MKFLIATLLALSYMQSYSCKSVHTAVTQLEIQVTVLDKYDYQIAGVDCDVFSGGSVIGHGITNDKGILSLLINAPLPSDNKITITATIISNIYSQSQTITGVTSSTKTSFIGQLKLQVGDILIGDPVRRCSLTTNFFDAETKKPLPDTVLDLTIYYVYKDKESSFKFIGRSDNTGQLNFHLFIPDVPAAIVVYTAYHLAYWSTQQLDKSNKDYMLFPNNAFSISMNPKLSTSTIQYTLSGLVFDAKANKALQNAQISLTGIEEDSKSKLPTGTATSESDGKYSVTITISPYSKYLFTLSIQVPKYLSYEKQFEYELDLTKPVATLSKNYEKVQLEQVPGKLILSGTITDLTNIVKFIKDAQISIKYDTTQPAIVAISDAAGKYTTTINVPVDEKLSIIETISALNFITKIQDQKIITVKQGVPYELTIDTQLDRVKQNIVIKDTLIDQLSKPIISASIQLIKSIPNIIGFDYTKTVMDSADGSFSFPFQCYQGVQFKADFTVVAPTYLPKDFETPTSECADLTIKSTLLILSKIKVVLILKANVIDATQQPFKGLVINYTVNPPIDGLIIGPLTSDANGIIQFPNLQVLPRSEYSFQITYKNAIAEIIKQDLNYLITDEKSQEYQFIIQYQSIVKASIGGTLTTSTGKATSPVQLQCTCDSKGKDGKPLDITTTSKADGTYQFDFETLAESDQKVNCKVIPKGVIVQPSMTPVQLVSPKFAAVQSIVIVYNTFEITVKGIIKDIITNQAIEGADVTLLISPEYMAKKSRKLKHLATSTIVIKTAKDGSYQTIFKILSGQQTEIDIAVKKASFEDGIKKVTVTGAKSEVVDGSLALNRIAIITKIHSTVIRALDKKPVPNAMVQIVTSTPEIAHSKYYNVQVKDDDKGSFYLDFQCYLDLEYTLTMSLEVPSFVTQTIQSSKFLCSKPATEIQPLVITLEKIVVSSTISGKVIDPHGEPKSGLALQFNTDPVTMPLTAITAADGTWSVTDTKIIPNTPYTAIVTFQDGIKEPIKLTQAMNIATANQKVQFADVHYADLVDATVTGNIVLEKGQITQPVTLTVSCPQNKDAKGIPFTKDFQTTATGTYNIQFQILAQSDQIAKCNIVSKNIIQPVNLPFQLQSPDFTAVVIINSKLPSSVITISGVLSDQIKAVSQLPNVEVSLALKPADPLTDAVIKTKTDANSKYTFKFEVVKGQKYEGTITANYAPEFQVQNQIVQIDGISDQIITKDMALIRVIVSCKITSELDDINHIAIKDSNVEIVDSKPKMEKLSLYNQFVQAPQGIFSIPFECYYGLKTSITLAMNSPIYKQTQLPEQLFECGPSIVKLNNIIVSAETFEVVIQGVISDNQTKQKLSGADIVVTISPEFLTQSKHQFLRRHLGFSQVNLKSATDGSYKLSFKVIAGSDHKIEVKVKDLNYQDVDKTVEIHVIKNEIITQDIILNRILLITDISSSLVQKLDKKPISNAKIEIKASNPTLEGSKYYDIETTSNAKGEFNLQFQCYTQLEYILTYEIDVQTYLPQKINSEKFVCSSSKTPLKPLEVKLEKIVLPAIISGKVIDPHGNPKSGLALQFNTDPVTMPLTATTASDGTWSVTDTKIIPNTPYTAIVTFQDGIKEPIKLTQAMNIATANQKVQFADVHYADLVDATVTGNIVLEKGQITQPVTLTVSCPQNKDAKGIPFTKDFQTTATGTYNIQFQILAQSDQIAKCNIVSKNIIQPVNLPFQAQSPDFTAKVIINSKLPSSAITISGIISDQIKAVSQLPNVEVILTLKPADPLTDAVIKTKTDANSKYTFKFEVVKGQKYEGTITVNYAPEFQQQNIVIQIDGTNDQTLTKDIILSRIIVQCKIQSELDDMNKKPIPNASLLILSSKPQMDDKNLYNKAVQAPTGTFDIPFTCYKGLQTVVNFQMTSPTYKPTSLSPQQFDCGPPIIKLPNIIVKAETVSVIFTGKVADATGIVSTLSETLIGVALTPELPYEQSLKATTDKNGNYQLVIQAETGLEYSFILTFQHSDFNVFSTKSNKLNLLKPDTITTDALMERIILKPTLSSSLQDAQKAPVKNAQITGELSPVVKGLEKDKINSTADVNGKFDISFQCYQNIEETMLLQLQAPEYDSIQSTKLTFLCANAKITLSPITIQGVKKPTTTKLTLSGKVTNPLNKGQNDLILQLATIPITKTYKTTTIADGTWQIVDSDLLIKTKYTLQISYTDGSSSQKLVTQDFYTELAESQLVFQEIFYSDLILTNIYGSLTAPNAIPVSQLILSLSCNSWDESKKNVQMDIRSDIAGGFKFIFKILATLKQSIDCKVTTETSNQKFNSISIPIIIIPPIFTYQVQAELTLTPQFQAQIDRYYTVLYIKGQLLSSKTCEGKIISNPVSGAIAELYQWHGLDYASLRATDLSDKSGIFVIQYTILNTQLQNEMKIEVTKEQFYNASYNFNLYSYKKQFTNKLNINLDTKEMIHIGGQLPCDDNQQLILPSSEQHLLHQLQVMPDSISVRGVITNQQNKFIKNCQIIVINDKFHSDNNGQFNIQIAYRYYIYQFSKQIQIWFQHKDYYHQSLIIQNKDQILVHIQLESIN